MSGFLHHLELAAPYFILVLVGYALSRSGRFKKAVSDALASFVFAVAVPSLLFRLMSDPSRLPPFDARLLIAFFGGCLVTFFVGRMASKSMFGLDGVGQSIFGLGGIFSNNVLLGIPLAKVILGERRRAAAGRTRHRFQFADPLDPRDGVGGVGAAWRILGGRLPADRARNRGCCDLSGAAILSGGSGWLTGMALGMVDEPLRGCMVRPPRIALRSCRLGLSEYGIRSYGIRCAHRLLLDAARQPLAVGRPRRLLGLHLLETQASSRPARLTGGRRERLHDVEAVRHAAGARRHVPRAVDARCRP